MAYLHCHACGWAQDDFWTRSYNPFTKFWEDVKWLWRPRFMTFDDYIFPDLIKYTWIPVLRWGGKKGTTCFSWNWLLLEVVKELKVAWEQKWWTWELWKKHKDTRPSAQDAGRGPSILTEVTMPEIAYKPKNFKEARLATIAIARDVVADYQAQGFNLTLRQLFYNFVSHGRIPNTERSYKNLGATINEARLAGMLDWDAIVDRLRKKEGNTHWASPMEIVEAAVESYKIDTWAEQPYRYEIWVEKDALAEVISRAALPLDVDYFACKGYVSQSAMWRAAQRLIGYEKGSQRTIILYLGDHDPSGIDMTRDIQERLALFGSTVSVVRIALTMDQIEEQDPPPNPTKATDARANAYVEEYGTECWELDALEPRYLVDLITMEVESLRDDDLWTAAVEKEKLEQDIIAEAAEDIKRKWDK